MSYVMQELMSEYMGENLKRKREASLLTQEELAAKLEVKKLTISQWENSNARPSLKHLRALKEYFEKQKS
jgi:transcriptional regulator with XRE-family HTH domain